MTATYNNPKSLLLACFALLLLHTLSYGQFRGRYDYDERDRATMGTGYLNGGDTYDCVDFFKDTADRKHMHTKRIVATNYTARDSSFANKRFSGKRVWLFNNRGRETMFVRYDSSGKSLDSLIYIYDKDNGLIQSATYARDSGIMKKKSSTTIVRNEKGDRIKDSSWNAEDAAYNSYCAYTKYDEKGNEISEMTIRGGDTAAFITYQYDDKGRIIVSKRKFRDEWSSNYRKYDDSSNVIEETNYTNEDTMHNSSTYDNRNRLLTSMEYMGGKLKLKEKITNVYNDDGSSVRTEVEHKAGLGLLSCDMQETMVTITDHFGNEVSKISKRAQGNDTVTESDIDHYTYTFGGNVITDTDTHTVADGIWHSSTTIQIHDNKYDAREDLLEALALGCELVSGEKKMTYTYNDKKQVLEVNHYSLCDDATPYSTDVYSYYPDGVTLKQEKSGVGSGSVNISYGKDSQVLKIMHLYDGFAEQAVFEYEE